MDGGDVPGRSRVIAEVRARKAVIGRVDLKNIMVKDIACFWVVCCEEGGAVVVLSGLMLMSGSR